MKKAVAVIFVVALGFCAVVLWLRSYTEIQSITSCNTETTCDDTDGTTICYMDMDCDCTATSDGREFHATYQSKLVMNYKPTDDESRCGSWCASVCSEEAEEYFNQK